MTIPKTFQLFGQTITVEIDPDLSHEDDASGAALYRTNKIKLTPSTSTDPKIPAQIEKVFLHELMHWIFYMAGESKLRSNEKLVDLIANLLHQALTTQSGKINLGEKRQKGRKRNE